MSRVYGFTPTPDAVIDDIDTAAAVVFGVVWRYCQMRDGHCNASLLTIAARSGYSINTVRRRLDDLVSNGWLAKSSREGESTIYKDTGKWSINLVGEDTNIEQTRDDSLGHPYHGGRGAPTTESGVPLPGRADPPTTESRALLIGRKKELKKADEEDNDMKGQESNVDPFDDYAERWDLVVNDLASQIVRGTWQRYLAGSKVVDVGSDGEPVVRLRVKRDDVFSRLEPLVIQCCANWNMPPCTFEEPM